jgi:hypothetical protein
LVFIMKKRGREPGGVIFTFERVIDQFQWRQDRQDTLQCRMASRL